MHLEPHQRLNHFRNGRELCRKDLLVKNLKRMKRGLQRDGQVDQARAYDFMPLSFVLPREPAAARRSSILQEDDTFRRDSSRPRVPRGCSAEAARGDAAGAARIVRGNDKRTEASSSTCPMTRRSTVVQHCNNYENS